MRAARLQSVTQQHPTTGETSTTTRRGGARRSRAVVVELKSCKNTGHQGDGSVGGSAGLAGLVSGHALRVGSSRAPGEGPKTLRFRCFPMSSNEFQSIPITFGKNVGAARLQRATQQHPTTGETSTATRRGGARRSGGRLENS